MKPAAVRKLLKQQLQILRTIRKQVYLEHASLYANDVTVFTEGSKCEESFGSGVVIMSLKLN